MTTQTPMFSCCCPAQSHGRVLDSQVPVNTDPANRAVTTCRDGLHLTAAQHILLTAQSQGGCKGQHKNINCLQKKGMLKIKNVPHLIYCPMSPIKTAYRNNVEASSTTVGQNSRILCILY